MRSRLTRKCNAVPAVYVDDNEVIALAKLDEIVVANKKPKMERKRKVANIDGIEIISDDGAIKIEGIIGSIGTAVLKEGETLESVGSPDDVVTVVLKKEKIARLPKKTKDVVSKADKGEKSGPPIIKSATNGENSHHLLVDLGDLTSMVVISRPSTSIKTPYVADLMEKPASYCRSELVIPGEEKITPVKGSAKKVSQKDKTLLKTALSNYLRSMVDPKDVHLGHTPALDCAGMIVPGAVVHCTPNDSNTKTRFTVQFCEEQREDGGVVTVACHPNLAERAARVLLEGGLLTEELGLYDLENVLRQQTFGKSRVDFVVQDIENNCITLVEVKNVVGADYIHGSVPAGRSEIGVYSVVPQLPDGSDYKRHAIFPHGSKKAEIGVVSDRAIKHVHELTCMHGTIDSQGRNVKSAILFIINRSDCEAFRPCHEADMVFAQMLLRARESGVQLIAKEVVWNKGTGCAGRSLPVAFDKSVSSAGIDEDHLNRILLFNENGSGRTPSPGKKKTNDDDGDDSADESAPRKEKRNLTQNLLINDRTTRDLSDIR